MHIIPFLRGEPVLPCDIDNVAYRTFLDASASGSRIVDHLSIEIHGGRSATIEIVCFTATEILHDPGKLVEGKPITFGSSAVSKTGQKDGRVIEIDICDVDLGVGQGLLGDGDTDTISGVGAIGDHSGRIVTI